MVKGAVDSIETFGLVDGPGIRTVVFLSGCRLRCKYCHNPEMWVKGQENFTPEELVTRILKNKNYFMRNGGVTFSGGEPLLQGDFLIEVSKLLKKEDIHIALDTSGVGVGNYEEILKYVDLVLLDIKHTDKSTYRELTGLSIDESIKFREVLNKSGKDVWIRQVIVPGVMDNDEYIRSLVKEVKKIKKVLRVDFLPYHKMAIDKYERIGIEYPYKGIPVMDRDRCKKLYNKFIKMYSNN